MKNWHRQPFFNVSIIGWFCKTNSTEYKKLMFIRSFLFLYLHENKWQTKTKIWKNMNTMLVNVSLWHEIVKREENQMGKNISKRKKRKKKKSCDKSFLMYAFDSDFSFAAFSFLVFWLDVMVTAVMHGAPSQSNVNYTNKLFVR